MLSIVVLSDLADTKHLTVLNFSVLFESSAECGRSWRTPGTARDCRHSGELPAHGMLHRSYIRGKKIVKCQKSKQNQQWQEPGPHPVAMLPSRKGRWEETKRAASPLPLTSLPAAGLCQCWEVTALSFSTDFVPTVIISWYGYDKIQI